MSNTRNPTYRYYITDTINGYVVGTNSEEHANFCAVNEDMFVVDVVTNERIQSDLDRVQVEGVQS